ncbi:hypothetical protein [Mesorhizobium sp.]|uniref:hypothetical protein n=1 Tax=Mesorhizobium sp. TaxID=1871066 RepID=UPI001202B74C|nr:hypothetical protein [Mesorhizobium sp.]TIN10367.1 MAG: helix-turn-helix domain-containing protein [Mesorhizobium sp.]
MTGILPRIYTLAEVAEHLRMTNRGVAKLARRHGLCLVRGRDLLFTESDVEGLKEAMRPAPTDPRRSIGAPSLSSYQLHKRLVELTRKNEPTAASSKARKLVLQHSKRPSHKKMLKEEFGE